MKIERFGKDAADRPCSEGYYATDGRTVYLMPPTAEMADGLRYATDVELASAPVVLPAHAALIRDYDPSPSDRKAE